MERHEYLLGEQARRCQKVDELLREYSDVNQKMNDLHKKIDALRLEDQLLNNQMTSIRQQIERNERKICQINRDLRSNYDPTRVNPKEVNGDFKNV